MDLVYKSKEAETEYRRSKLVTIINIHTPNCVRDYYEEQHDRMKVEERIYGSDPIQMGELEERSAQLRMYHKAQRDYNTEEIRKSMLTSTINQLYSTYYEQNSSKKERFQFYSHKYFEGFPENRVPAKGIIGLPYKYHTMKVVEETEKVGETGYNAHPLVRDIIETKFMEYKRILKDYCRPLGTTSATHEDFNREQVKCRPVPEYRKERILRHIKKRLNSTKYKPLHFVDTQHIKLPLNTGTGYHNRHSFKMRAHAKFSAPVLYKNSPTKKGYMVNAVCEMGRTTIHKIKFNGMPFDDYTEKPMTEEEKEKRIKRFFLQSPTILFTRNHISKRDGNLKQRPVYCVDDLFILIEAMLTFPLILQARTEECCIMQGLETVRGANIYLNKLATEYRSFFTIDWSQFDQRVSRIITDIYFTDYIRSLLVINHGYQPTYEYPKHDLTCDELYQRMDNLLNFLHTWYNNMVYYSTDGYAYARKYAGVPSGLLQTNYIDSFCNLFIMIDGMIEYGWSDDEIDEFQLFIMGDDNSGFSNKSLYNITRFIKFFEGYAAERWNMKLSATKCVITGSRAEIETLSYSCNLGYPTRPVDKLVAQLCYPERGTKPSYMSYRAIGLAYASAGSDERFYYLCRYVYNAFYDQRTELTEERKYYIHRDLPGMISQMENLDEVIDLERFPTLDEIRSHFKKYMGPLTFDERWKLNHFVESPLKQEEVMITMEDYEIEHKLERKQIKRYFY